MPSVASARVANETNHSPVAGAATVNDSGDRPGAVRSTNRSAGAVGQGFDVALPIATRRTAAPGAGSAPRAVAIETSGHWANENAGWTCIATPTGDVVGGATSTSVFVTLAARLPSPVPRPALRLASAPTSSANAPSSNTAWASPAAAMPGSPGRHVWIGVDDCEGDNRGPSGPSANDNATAFAPDESGSTHGSVGVPRPLITPAKPVVDPVRR